MRITIVGYHDATFETISETETAATWFAAALNVIEQRGNAFQFAAAFAGGVTWLGTWENLPSGEYTAQRRGRREVFTVVGFDRIADATRVDHVEARDWVEAVRAVIVSYDQPTHSPGEFPLAAYQFVAAGRGGMSELGTWQDMRLAMETETAAETACGGEGA